MRLAETRSYQPADSEEWCDLLRCALSADSELPGGVTLPQLCSSLYAHSESVSLTEFLRDAETVDDFPRQYQPALSDVDARDVLSTLLGVHSFPDFFPCLLAVHYVELLRRTFKQLVLATTRRRCAQRAAQSTSCSSQERRHLRRAVSSMMSSWAADVCTTLEADVFARLCRHDAAVDHVTTSLSPDDQTDSAGTDPTEATPSAVPLPYASHAEIMLLVQGAVSLLTDIHTVCGIDEVENVVVSLYGTVVAMLEDPHVRSAERDAEGVRQPGDSQEAGDDVARIGTAAVLAQCAVALTDMLLHVTHGGAPDSLSAILARHWRIPLLTRGGFAAEDTDAERGVMPVGDKELALWQSREETLRAISLFPTMRMNRAVDSGLADTFDGYPKDQEDSVVADPVQRQRVIGAVLLLLRVALGELDGVSFPWARSLVFLYSSEALFWSIAAPLTVALQCDSLTALSDAIGFLTALLDSLRPATLAVRAEGDVEERSSSVRSREHQWEAPTTAAKRFRTRKYQVLFELVKQLVSLTSLCPHSHVREAAKRAVEVALSRCEVSLRIRLAGSLFALCPFPSVARFLHSYLSNEWTTYNTTEYPARGPSDLYEAVMPSVLAEAMHSHVHSISLSHLGFLDCLIGELNFVRIFVAQEKVNARLGRLQLSAQGRVVFSAEASASAARAEDVTSWPAFLAWVKFSAIPLIRHRLLSDPAATVPHSSSFAPLQLSELDRFSLSMAIDGVTAVL